MDDIMRNIETIIVGLLTLPSLYLLLLLINLPLRERMHSSFKRVAKEEGMWKTIGAVTIVSAFILGNTILSTDYLFDISDFNDNGIKLDVYMSRDEMLKNSKLPTYINDILPRIYDDHEIDSGRLSHIKTVFRYQKYYICNDPESAQEVRSLQLKSTVLKGASLNSILTFCLFSMVFVKIGSLNVIRKFRKKERIPNVADLGTFLTLCIVLLVLYGICYFGYYEAELEYVKRIIGLYHGQQPLGIN